MSACARKCPSPRLPSTPRSAATAAPPSSGTEKPTQFDTRKGGWCDETPRKGSDAKCNSSERLRAGPLVGSLVPHATVVIRQWPRQRLTPAAGPLNKTLPYRPMVHSRSHIRRCRETQLCSWGGMLTLYLKYDLSVGGVRFAPV